MDTEKYIKEFLKGEEIEELSEDDSDLLHAYCDAYGVHCLEHTTMDNIRDYSYGPFDSQREWAEQYLEDCLELKGIALQYFDYDSYLRDIQMEGCETWGYCNGWYLFHGF